MTDRFIQTVLDKIKNTELLQVENLYNEYKYTIELYIAYLQYHLDIESPGIKEE